MKKTVRESLRDFKEIFPDTKPGNMNVGILANFGNETVFGGRTYADGTSYYDLGLIELHFKKIKKGHIKNFKGNILHELVHFKHKSCVFGALESPDVRSIIDAYKGFKESGIHKEINDWDSTAWNYERAYKEFSSEDSETTPGDLQDIRAALGSLVPYLYCTGKYRQPGKLSELKDLLSSFLEECRRRMIFCNTVPKMKTFKHETDNQREWEEFVNFEAPESDIGDDYERVSEVIPYYVSSAWYRDTADLSAEDIKKRYTGIDDGNVKYLEDVFELHKKLVSSLMKERPWLKGREVHKKAVKLVAREIVWAKDPEHLELICEEYTKDPGLLLEVAGYRGNTHV